MAQHAYAIWRGLILTKPNASKPWRMEHDLHRFIYDPIALDPEGIIDQGHGNQTARAIQVRRGETVNKQAFITLIQAVVANNRAGGWRKLKRNSETSW